MTAEPPPSSDDASPSAGAVASSPRSRSSPPPPTAPDVLDDFRAACEEHLDFVWRFAKACGVQPAAVEYVVHKVFAVVRGRLVSLEDPSERRVSIAGITRQVVRGYLHQLGSPLEPFGPPLTGPDDLEQIRGLETKTPAQLVDIILSAMSEAEREVFILSELEGFELFEIAEALHVSESTLRERLNDARKIFNDVSARLRAQRFWVSRRSTDDP